MPLAINNATGRAVPLTCIFLDSQSTVDLIVNPKMVVKIRKVRGDDAIQIYCNSRVKIVDRVGDLAVYGSVWYEPTGIINILLMSRERKKSGCL